MTRGALAARCRDLLGAHAGGVLVRGPHAGGLAAALAAPTDAAGAAVVSFLGAPADPAARQVVLASLRRALPADAPIVLVDHNQPRRLVPRCLGAALLVARGLPASRARYPAARELQALGYRVERLRLASGERVQLVAARTPA